MTLLAALSSASLVVGMVAVLAPPRRRLRSRLGPYLGLGRLRLGLASDGGGVARLVLPTEGSAITRILGSTILELLARLGRVIDATDHDLLAVRLRHAGESIDVAEYRVRQGAATVVGSTLGAVSGVLLLGGGRGTVLLIVCFGFSGAAYHRGRLDRAIDRRRLRMRAEVPTLAQLIAVHLRTGHGPIEAVRRVAVRSHGPVAADLREALASVTGGLSPQLAYERLAESTSEPVAGRLFRLLASSVRSGNDVVGPLMAISNEVRSEQREALSRAAVKRRSVMIVPLLLLVAPVMVLFVAAALPSLVFGR